MYLLHSYLTDLYVDSDRSKREKHNELTKKN